MIKRCVLVALCLGLTCACSGGAGGDVPRDWVQYTHTASEPSFSFRYPPEWTIFQEQEEGVIFTGGSSGSYAAVSAFESMEDEDVDCEISSDTEASLQCWTEYVESVFDSDLEILGSETHASALGPIISLEYSGTPPGLSYAYTIDLVMHADTNIMLMYWTGQPLSDRERDQALTALKSLEFPK